MLRGIAGIMGFAQVDAQVSQVRADRRIDLGAEAGGASNQNVLTLAGFDEANLNALDFLI